MTADALSLYQNSLWQASFLSLPLIGAVCDQKRFPPQTGDFFTGLGREVFYVSGWLGCNSEQRVIQVFSARNAAQSLRGNNQKNRD